MIKEIGDNMINIVEGIDYPSSSRRLEGVEEGIERHE